MRFCNLFLSVLLLCVFVAPAGAKTVSKVVVTIDRTQTTFQHRGSGDEVLSPADPGVAAVEASVRKSLGRLASGANQLLYNWYDLIVAKDADANYQLTLAKVDVKYTKRGEVWKPTAILFEVRRRFRGAPGEEWVDAGAWRSASGPIGGDLEGKHLGALFQKAMFHIPPSREGGVCPLLIVQALTAEIEAAWKTEGVWQ